MIDAHRCSNCDCRTLNPENECGEFICDDCEQNAAEAAYERQCEDFHCGGGSEGWQAVKRLATKTRDDAYAVALHNFEVQEEIEWAEAAE
jgi:hypothetical protein